MAGAALERIPYHRRVVVKERIARAIGLPWDEISRIEVHRAGLADVDDSTRAIADQVRSFTLPPPDRVAALCGAIDYLIDHDIPGDIVECGLWKGGSLMACAMRLRDRGATDRRIVGFDTFEGMTDPMEGVDVDWAGVQAPKQGKGAQMPIDADLDSVYANLRSTGYPAERIELVKGDVMKTLPAQAPEQLALLRLDTDFYDSTKHELETLYPRLVTGGVLLIDDYGHFRGSRKATDEYFAGKRILLARIDFSARLAVKQD